MYYPVGFDHDRAVQLAELVRHGYTQLKSFQKKTKWTLRGKYELAAELKYREAESPAKKGILGQLNEELHRYAKSKLQMEEGLPIGFIALGKSEVFLVFRGTMTITELLRDFNTRAAAYPHMRSGKTHVGFLQIYNIFRDTILETLNGIGPGRKLFVAGHSLGAALATLAVPDIVTNTQFTSPTVYTFASPRVGDSHFADTYNQLCGSRTFRIANTCDLVTAMPFPVPFLRFIGGFFTHVDTPVDFTVQKEDLEKNHEIGTYIEALMATAPRSRPLKALFKKTRR